MKGAKKGSEFIISNDMEQLVESLNNGVAYDLETQKGYTQILRIEIKDAISRHEPQLVMNDTNGHFIQLLEGDGDLIIENDFNTQRHYVVGYIFEHLVEIEEAMRIEKHLIERIDRKFPHQAMGGFSKALTRKGNMILKGKVEDYKYNQGFLKVDDFTEEAQRQEELDHLIRNTRLSSHLAYREVKEAELEDMIKFVRKNKLKAKGKDFHRIAFGMFNHNCEFTDQMAVKVLNAIGGDGNYNSYVYAPYKKSSPASFYKWISDHGYKFSFMDRYYEAMTDEEVNIVREEPISIKRFINELDIYEAIKNSFRNILISSPTGSGKTTAIVAAAKMWMDEDIDNHYFLFLLPTIALVEQTAEGKEMGEGLAKRRVAKKVMINNLVDIGYNAVAGTYDKAQTYIDEINLEHPNAKILVVVDEAHKEVSDYYFRRPAISSVAKVKEHEQVFKFIGLSGTPQEIDKAGYDQLVTFELSKKEAVFKNLVTPIYNESKEFLSIVTRIINREVKSGRKVLLFLQRKVLLEDIKKSLDRLNVKSVLVRADLKTDEEKEAYDYLIEKEKFSKEFDVFLSTNFIADGVNVLNESDKYSVIIAPERSKSQIFNLSQIKQMSNRLRYTYENLIIPIFIGKEFEKERLEHDEPFGFETRFNKLMHIYQAAANDLRERFGDRLDEYQPSDIERMMGLPWVNDFKDTIIEDIGAANLMKMYRHYTNRPLLGVSKYVYEKFEAIRLMQEILFTVDRRTIRKKVSLEQEEYYKFFPMAFIRALEDILEGEAIQVDVDDFLANVNLDASALIDMTLAEREEMRKEKELELREAVEDNFTTDLYDEIVREYKENGNRFLKDSPLFTEMEEKFAPMHLQTIENHIEFSDYDVMLNVLKRTDNKNKQSHFKKRLRNKHNLEEFDKATEKTVEHRILEAIKRIIADEKNYIADAKGRNILDNRMYEKEVGLLIADDKDILKKSQVDNVFKDYFMFETTRATINGDSVRGKINIELIDDENIANEFGVKVIDIQKAYREYIYNRYQTPAVA